MKARDLSWYIIFMVVYALIAVLVNIVNAVLLNQVQNVSTFIVGVITCNVVVHGIFFFVGKYILQLRLGLPNEQPKAANSFSKTSNLYEQRTQVTQ